MKKDLQGYQQNQTLNNIILEQCPAWIKTNSVNVVLITVYHIMMYVSYMNSQFPNTFLHLEQARYH